jgi:hypothetical protein
MANPTLSFSGSTKLVPVPNVGVLSFSGGIADGQTFKGSSNNINNATKYTIDIVVDTGLQKGVQWAVPQVSLGKIANQGSANDAVWRITATRVTALGTAVSPAEVTVEVDVEVGDSDGYLEGFAVSLQAFGAN